MQQEYVIGSDWFCKKDLQVKGLSVISRKFDTQGQKGMTGTMQDASRRMDGQGAQIEQDGLQRINGAHYYF